MQMFPQISGSALNILDHSGPKPRLAPPTTPTLLWKKLRQFAVFGFAVLGIAVFGSDATGKEVPNIQQRTIRNRKRTLSSTFLDATAELRR